MGLFSYTSAEIANLFRDRSGFHLDRIRSVFQAVVTAFTTLDSVATVGLSAEAEAADNIPVQVTLKDLAGIAKARAQRLVCEVLDENMELAAAADFTMSETGSGTEISTTAMPQLLIDTHSSGVATLTVHDVAGASGATVYLRVTPVSTGTLAPGLSTIVPLTFD